MVIELKQRMGSMSEAESQTPFKLKNVRDFPLVEVVLTRAARGADEHS